METRELTNLITGLIRAYAAPNAAYAAARTLILIN